MKIHTNRTKAATVIMTALVLGLVLLPPTIMPTANGQGGISQPSTSLPFMLPALPVRAQNAPFKDMTVYGPDNTVYTIPAATLQNSWAEGTAVNPESGNPNNLPAITGIGATPDLLNQGSTSFATPATFEVVSLTIKDSSGSYWSLQDSIGWGNGAGSTNNYVNSIWLIDVATGAAYSQSYLMGSSILNNQYNLEIYYNSSAGKWYYQTYDGVQHPITDIPNIPSGDLSTVDSISSSNFGQEGAVIESYDTTSTDFNNFNSIAFNNQVRTTGGSWETDATSTSTNIYGYSAYNTGNPCGVTLNLGTYVGGTLVAPTAISTAGNYEYVHGYVSTNIGPGVGDTNAGFPNYWCNQITGKTAVQQSSPGSGYTYWTGERLW